MLYKICSIVILIAFYAVYIGKMICQKRKGIQTDQIAKGKKEAKLFVIELIMKIVTYSIIAIQVIGICLEWTSLPVPIRTAGIVLGLVGDSIFASAVWTMKDNWRAGIPKEDKTTIVTKGIYSYSRNPAFLGFDLMYLGILLLYFNWLLFLFTVLAMVMLHLQILQEEAFLPTVFGQEYAEYKNRVGRYFGKRGWA